MKQINYTGSSKLIARIINLLNKKAPLPLNQQGEVDWGTDGKVLGTDGVGGTKWVDPGSGGGNVADVKVNGSSVVDANKVANVTVPTKVSDLTNDAGFITNTVNNLTNYYLSSATYTKTEVDNLISAIITLNVLVVQSLPVSDISTTTIYLVPKSTPDTQDVYDEYINLDGTSSGWEHIGSTQIDLSNYYTKSEINALLSAKANTADLATVATSGSYNDLDDKPTIPAAQIQSDWNQSDNTQLDYIKNKPTIPSSSGHTIWNRIKTALTARANLWFKDANVSDASTDGTTVVEVVTELESESAFDNLPTDGSADGIYAFPDSGDKYLDAYMVGYRNGSVGDALDSIFLKVYPIGSIYMSTINTNPSIFFGGTWISWGSGRVPVGVDTNDTNFNTVEKTGGSNSENYTPSGSNAAVTLTAAQSGVPAHSHGLNNHTHSIPALSGTASSTGSAHQHEIPKQVNNTSDGGHFQAGTSSSYISYFSGNEAKTTSSGAHSHSVTTVANTTGQASGSTANNTAANATQSHNHSFTGTQATISHLQQYITCYMWKRTE